MTKRHISLAALGLTLFAAACHDDELFRPPVPSYPGASTFYRYVALGNSITAGVQSVGISDSLQRFAYPLLVAGAMAGSPFYYPSLNNPGCPPPFDTIFTSHRVGGTAATTCLFRSSFIPPYLSNVAVPFARTLDLLQNLGSGTTANPLTQLLLGGQTQLEAMMASRPTFVTVWIGNNDVLRAVTASVNPGDPALVTPAGTFQTEYRQILDSIKAAGARGLLIGVPKVTNVPYLSTGLTYFQLKAAGQFPLTFTVLANCDSTGANQGDSILVPFPYGVAKVDSAARGLAATTLDCSIDAATIQPSELVNLATTVAAYNTYIRSQAQADSSTFGYLDPNGGLDSLRLIPAAVRPFPVLTQTVPNPPGPAVTRTAGCNLSNAPGVVPSLTGSPFGTAFSCDGLHPSTSTHRLIAQKVVQTINAWFGTAIPAVP